MPEYRCSLTDEEDDHESALHAPLGDVLESTVSGENSRIEAFGVELTSWNLSFLNSRSDQDNWLT